MTTLLTKQLVDASLIAKIHDEGYELFVRKSDWSENPLKALKMTFVGDLYGRVAEDSDFQQSMSQYSGTIDKEVANYAKYHGHDKDDILAFAVFCPEGDKVTYTTNPRENSKFVGFIYTSKKYVREVCDVKRISPRIKLSRQNWAELALKRLSLWSYGQVHEVSIERDDDVIACQKDIYSLDFMNTIAEQLLSSIDECA